MAPTACPSCGSGACTAFYEAHDAPISSHDPFSSRAEAIALPRGDIDLTFCGACGLVFNASFDPSRAKAYTDAHGEGRRFAAFLRFERSLADHLVARYALRGKEILEVGRSGGDFLRLLCKLGDNRGIGLDPGYVPQLSEDPVAGHMTFGREAPTEHSTPEPTDFVFTRSVLERIPDPARFIIVLRRVVSQRKHTRLFLEVPDLMPTLRHSAFWEIHYEQCSYFSPGTMQRLLRAHGFVVGDMWSGLDGQVLLTDAQAADHDPASAYAGDLLEPMVELERLVARFALECRQLQLGLCAFLRDAASAGNRIMVWGAGPRTVALLTTLSVSDEVGWVVDFDPRRQGKYLPGTGHLIISPEAAAALRPDVLIVMNWIYALEIQDLLASIGCNPTLLIA